MLSRQTPLGWRRGFSLYRRKLTSDSLGNPVASYDLEHPDYVARDGTAEGISWQSLRSWQSSGRLTSGGSQGEQGEAVSGVLEGCLFSALVISTFDRIRLEDGALYEIRAIQRWPSYRKLLAQRIG